MVVSLLHNPGAGEGEFSRSEIMSLLENAGHRVRSRSIKDSDYAAALDEPADAVLVAGGDGTVAEVAFHCIGRGMPLGVLSTGTANNIAGTLGVPPSLPRQVELLSGGKRRRIDVATARGQWGGRHFIEGAGMGLLPLMLATRARHKMLGIADPVDSHGSIVGGRRLMRDLLQDFGGHRIAIEADGENLSGSYLMVEVMNIRACGPALAIAPDADPGDGFLDLMLLGEDRRADLERYLDGDGGPAGEEKEIFATGLFRRHLVRKVTLASAEAAFHSDDWVWPEPRIGASRSGPLGLVDVSINPGALEFFVP